MPGRNVRSPGEAAKLKGNGELDQHHTQGRHDRDLISRRPVSDRDSPQLAEFGQEQSYWIALQCACKRTLGFESAFDGTRISNPSSGRMRIAGSSLHRRLLTGRSKLRLELGFMVHQYPLLSANLIHEGFGGG